MHAHIKEVMGKEEAVQLGPVQDTMNTLWGMFEAIRGEVDTTIKDVGVNNLFRLKLEPKNAGRANDLAALMTEPLSDEAKTSARS